MASKNLLRKVGPAKQKTRCVKVCDANPVDIPEASKRNVLKLVQLIWLDSRTVAILTPSGAEAKFEIK